MNITVYFEGGGNSAETKAALRQGMSGFLKPLVDMARQQRSRWSIVSCGGRDEAYEDFCDALEKEPHIFNVLLVDSETGITGSPRAHLQQRDGWDLAAAQEDQVHLMAQCMEAWLVADPEALADYYSQCFNHNALSKRVNLEEEPKAQIYASLEAATRQTQKGSYAKIRHASALLKHVSKEKAKRRCPHCRRFFDTVGGRINQGNQ